MAYSAGISKMAEIPVPSSRRTQRDTCCSLKVLRALKIRAKVTGAPPSAVPTSGNVGGDDETDSDLRSDGTSFEFQLKQRGLHKFVDLGYQA